jgi:hypothetical protein
MSSNRTQFGSTSHMTQPTTLRPALVRRSSSQRPRVGPRTRSYTGTGTGAGHSSRAPEQRHSASYAPRRDLNSMIQPSSRPSFMRALTAMNTSLNRASPRTVQPSAHDGTRRMQVVQPGHRGGTHRTEHTHVSEHTHVTVAHASVAPARRSQRISSAAAQDRRPSTATTHSNRPSTAVVNSRPSTAMVPHGHGHGPVEQHHGHGRGHGHGPEHIHGTRGLVRVGGSRGGYPHH